MCDKSADLRFSERISLEDYSIPLMVGPGAQEVLITYPNAKETKGRRWLPPHNRPAPAPLEGRLDTFDGALVS